MKKIQLILLALLVCSSAYALQLGSKADAGNAINRSYEIIAEMNANNFSTLYVYDTLLEAERVYKQVRYVEILNNLTSAGTVERKAAKDASELVDLTGTTYNDVIKLTDEIQERRNQAFALYDRINLEKADIIDYYGADYKSKENSSGAVKALMDAEISFYQDRYGEVEQFLQSAKSKLNFEKSLLATMNTITANSKNFVMRNWFYILIFIAALSGAGFTFYKHIRHYMLKKKIAKMKIELGVITNLIKKTQAERYRENKISGLVYDIRMRKYNQRTREIKEELPWLEKIYKKGAFHKHKHKIHGKPAKNKKTRKTSKSRKHK